MTDDEIAVVLRAHAGHTAVELAELLNRLTLGRLSQSTIVTYFKRAFPDIPLRILLEAGGWSRVGGGTLGDADFNDLLRPWVEGSGHG
jgi:hypothetical protein